MEAIERAYDIAEPDMATAQREAVITKNVNKSWIAIDESNEMKDEV